MRARRLLWIPTLVVVGFGAFLALGVATTQLLISDGLAEFTGRNRVAAQDALAIAYSGCLDNPIARVLIGQKIKVVDLKLGPASCAGTGDDYAATVRAYTFFGIPTGTISVRCGDVDCPR